MAKHHRNPFPQPSALETQFLNELSRVARFCYDRGWSHGTAGNFSLRGRDGLVWQSPTGWNKGDLDPSSFIPVELGTGKAVNPCSAKPSGEMPVHLGVFRAITAAKSVVHAHPPHLTRLSRAGKPIVFQGQEMQKHLGCHDHLETASIPVLTNPTPEQMPAMANELGPQLNEKVPVVVLAAHGAYAWGPTPMAALSYLEAAEYLCATVEESP